MIKKKTEDEVSASVVAPKVKERKPDTAADIERKKRAEAITATIFKLTAQKPLGVSYDPWPTVPTGAMIIDNMIGGTPLENGSGQICPGYPRGRIVEIFGGESSGKTTLALAAISKVQKAGGIAMFLDYENALSHVYAKAIGVDFDPSRLIYLAPQDLEQGMRMAQIAIKGGCDLIVVDSVAAMVPNVEMAKTADEGPQIGIQARVFSNILPKMVQWLKGSSTVIILLNQTRATISKGGPATPEENTSGGKAIKFYASVRLKLTRTKSEILEKKDPVTLEKKKFPYGNVTQVKMVKNKMDGTQGRTGSIFIRFGFGVDEYLSTIEGACPRKIITRKSASSYVYKDLQFRGRDKLRRYFIENPKEFAEVQKKVTEALLSETLITSVDDAEEDDTILQVDIPSSDLASGGDETEAYGINTDED
jgi:recombination protein RecA